MRRLSLGLIGVVVLACYAVPYLFLDETAAWNGAFLFWVIAGLAVIVLNFGATRDFDDEEDGQ